MLFLDEISLYRNQVLETLRAPLEEGVIRIARSGGVISFPCRFSLVAAMNPCPCGFSGDHRRACRCSAHQLEIYRTKLSGPLLDRFDIQVGMTRPSREELLGEPEGDSGAVVRAQVEAARRLQSERHGASSTTNASASKSSAAERGSPDGSGSDYWERVLSGSGGSLKASEDRSDRARVPPTPPLCSGHAPSIQVLGDSPKR